MTQALLSGHLDLSISPDPRHLALPDPYDPVANRPFRIPRRTQDASLFEGRFYYYFGAGPVVALFAPWRLLTGRYLREDAAVPIFLTGAAVLWWALVRAVLRHSKLDPPPALALGLIALMSLSYFVPLLARNPDTYQTAIAAGAFFAALGLYGLARGLLAPEPSPRALLLAGLSFGLAFASRPTHLLDLMLMAPASAAWVARTSGDRRRGRGLAALWGGWLAVAASVLAYNWARFRDPFQFGGRYQLASLRMTDVSSLSPSFAPLNLYLYLVAPPTVGPEFPFVRLMPRGLPPRPPEYQTFEAIAGLVVCAPLVLLAAGWPLLARRRRALALVAAALVLQGIAMLLFLSLFRFAAARHILDFAPFLAGAAALAWARLDEIAAGRRAWRVLLHTLAGGLLGYGLLVSGAAALGGMYGEPSGAASEALERAAAPLQREWLRREQGRYGNVELELALPPAVPGRVETLLTAGDVYRRSVVCLEYVGHRQIAFALDARGGVQVRSPAIRLRPEATHRVGIEMGALLPLGRRAAERVWPGRPVETWRERLRVTVDGDEAMETSFDFQPAAAYVDLGRNWFASAACPSPFSGSIVGVRRWLPEPVP